MLIYKIFTYYQIEVVCFIEMGDARLSKPCMASQMDAASCRFIFSKKLSESNRKLVTRIGD
jgi:hypothetical protein